MPGSMQKIEEFDEACMFEDDHGGPYAHGQDSADDDGSCSGNEDEVCAYASVASTRTQSCDILGPNDDSGKSGCTTLHDIREVAVALSRGDRKGIAVRGAFAQAFSLPAPASAIRMGCSVPISIPGLPISGRPREGDGCDDEDDEDVRCHYGTFIPPHKLSQRDDGFMISINGASPSAALKRDRLRTRNAILKSTGFLEHHVPLAATIGMQERHRLLNIAGGGLSQALHAGTTHG